MEIYEKLFLKNSALPLMLNIVQIHQRAVFMYILFLCIHHKPRTCVVCEIISLTAKQRTQRALTLKIVYHFLKCSWRVREKYISGHFLYRGTYRKRNFQQFQHTRK